MSFDIFCYNIVFKCFVSRLSLSLSLSLSLTFVFVFFYRCLFYDTGLGLILCPLRDDQQNLIGYRAIFSMVVPSGTSAAASNLYAGGVENAVAGAINAFRLVLFNLERMDNLPIHRFLSNWDWRKRHHSTKSQYYCNTIGVTHTKNVWIF